MQVTPRADSDHTSLQPQLSSGRRTIQEATPAVGCPSGVFINEVHYRNGGDDANEFVELAGPVDTVLIDYNVIVFSTTGVAETPVTVSGILQGVSGSDLGVLLVDFDLAGVPIPNGGVAVSDTNNVPCDFISFGRTLTSDGNQSAVFPADVVSYDIMLREDAGAPADGSIGRIDNGAVTPVWTTFDVSSRGELNPGQLPIIPPPPPPPLPTSPFPACSSGVFINEVHYRNAGDDVNEFVELAGPVGTDVSYFHVIAYSTTGVPEPPITVSGTLAGAPGSSLGFLLVDFSLAGVPIPNGGVAVSDEDRLPCDFISFNRTLTSSADAFDVFPADVVSYDIMMREDAGAPADGSLGRIDGGTNMPVWHTFDISSGGEANPGQEFV